jgi:regulator of replication initiation timing
MRNQPTGYESRRCGYTIYCKNEGAIMNTSSPFSFLLDNRQLIAQAHNQNAGKTKDTWQVLQKTLPELSQLMSFNTFKQYVAALLMAAKELDKVIHKLDQALRQNAALQHELGHLTAQLDKVRQTPKGLGSQATPPDKELKRIEGWSVQRAKDGYYRCYRKIDNRLHCLYIGKILNVEKTKQRIQQKEKQLGLYTG